MAGLLCVASPAAAADLGTFDGFDIRLDTTLRASLGFRVEGQNPALLSNVNADDGDRAFKPGVVSERMDFTSQLDVARGDFGLDLSADGWYDAAYQTHDANRSTTTFNPVTVPVNAFPGDVRRLMGGMVELGNAYVRDKVDLAGLPVTLRIGRQTLLWGESLFFPEDGIAAAQAPVDVIKEISQPLIEARELFLPVSQADIRISLPHGMSIEAYDQFEWRRDRTPGVASYFSTSDIADVGGQRAFTSNGVLYRGRDSTPSGLGQFGLALRRSSDVADLGLYVIRYNAKEPQIVANDVPGATYRAVFPQGIWVLGLSGSTYIGNDTLSGEVSERWNMPLVSNGLVLLGQPAHPGTLYVGGSPRENYATGRTLQALVSFEKHLRPGRFWNAAVLDAEIAFTDLLGVDAYRRSRLSGTTHAATAFQVVFSPMYFQVLPGLDLLPQLGVEYGLSGRSSIDPGMVARAGNVTFSVSATYRAVWQGGIAYTHFIAPPGLQALADRDFVIASMSRAF